MDLRVFSHPQQRIILEILDEMETLKVNLERVNRILADTQEITLPEILCGGCVNWKARPLAMWGECHKTRGRTHRNQRCNVLGKIRR